MRIPRDQTAVEDTLARIWRQTLDVERVAADSDFFELGGHSLMAIRVSMLAAEEFGVAVPAAALISDSLFSTMVERIEEDLQHMDTDVLTTATSTEYGSDHD